MSHSGFRAVLFDLDDTLLDSAPAFARALEGAVRTIVARHPHLNPEDVLTTWSTVHGPLMAALDAGETTMVVVRTERFRRVLAALRVGDDAFADEIDLALGRDQLAALRLFPDAEVIEALRRRGPFVGIVTNGAGDAHPDSQRTKAAHVGLLDRVDGIWISDETGHRKPDPRAFAPALAAAGCAPEEALYVGDSVANDVVGANRAGLVSVRLLRGPDDRHRTEGEARPARTIGSLREIERLLDPPDRAGSDRLSPMTFASREAGGLPYRLHIPAGEGPFTAILFLHGAGESGGDNEAQIRIGLPPRVRPGSPWDEFIVVAPQKPSAAHLWPAHTEALDAILREVEAELGDRLGGRRILTGLSQGGHGTLNLARSLRWDFSALAAICGWIDRPADAGLDSSREERWRAPAGEWADPALVRERLGGLPLWLFHGTEDESVAVARTQEIADLLPEARLSIYPGVGHDSWEPAYDEPALPGWLASQ